MSCGCVTLATASSQTASPDNCHPAATPEHLVVLANGILSSPADWKHFRSQLLKEPGQNLLVYADKDNINCHTLGGIDVAGKRLARGILEVVEKTPSLRRISFVAHSLGGLFVRYCLALLYRPGVWESDDFAEGRSAGIEIALQVGKSNGVKAEKTGGFNTSFGVEELAYASAEEQPVERQRLEAKVCQSCRTVAGTGKNAGPKAEETQPGAFTRQSTEPHKSSGHNMTRDFQESTPQHGSTLSNGPSVLAPPLMHASANPVGANLDAPGQKLISELAAHHRNANNPPNFQPSRSTPSKTKQSGATIAGLEPAHLILIAVPHLGVWGRRQWPFARGVHSFERVASCFSGMFLGRTLGQLFLRDWGPSGEPLLLSMSKDCEGRPFISALGAFQTRHMYANVKYDKALDWKTSCIRSDEQLDRVRKACLERAAREEWIHEQYPYIVHIENTSVESARESCTAHASALVDYVFTPPLTKRLSKAFRIASRSKLLENNRVAVGVEKGQAHKWSSEEACRALAVRMISGLHGVSWEKVDVLYHGAPSKWYAHQMLIMKDARKQAAGQGVVNHMVDVLCGRI